MGAHSVDANNMIRVDSPADVPAAVEKALAYLRARAAYQHFADAARAKTQGGLA